MPRLNHKKARTGCQRCKARKVKRLDPPLLFQSHVSLTKQQCDEQKPRCGACARHDVACDYAVGPSKKIDEQDSLPSPPKESPASVQTGSEDLNDLFMDPRLELRLMHEWTAYTCHSITTTWQFWCYQVPLLSLDYRFVLDAMLALAALHASRQQPSQWIQIDGRMIPIRNPQFDSPLVKNDALDPSKLQDYERALARCVAESPNNPYLSAKRSEQMLSVSRRYFARALDGHRKILPQMTVQNIEAVYVASILVSFTALVSLSESDEDPTQTPVDPLQWLRLNRGINYVCSQWSEFVGNAWQTACGAFYGQPNLHDADELFNVRHCKPFARLLTWAEDYEVISIEDRRVYRDVLCYIGLIYKGMVEGTDIPLGTCRRFLALPSRCPARFVDFFEQKQPRAWAIMGHIFALMNLLSVKAPWFKGIAEKQVPKIYEQLPTAWLEMMAWPVAVAQGDIHREPNETQIDDVRDL